MVTPETLYKQLERSTIGSKRQQEVLTTFDREIHYYNRDEVTRQDKAAQTDGFDRITYEDHRKALDASILMFKKTTQHDIAMNILTHRYFKNYRTKAFMGKGSFRNDYSFLILKIGTLFNPESASAKKSNIRAKLDGYNEPTLVQVNFISNDVTPVKMSATKSPQEWAQIFNKNAPESTKYFVAGIKVG